MHTQQSAVTATLSAASIAAKVSQVVSCAQCNKTITTVAHDGSHLFARLDIHTFIRGCNQNVLIKL